MKHKTLELYYSFINLFFPQVCESCGTALFKNEEVICTNCLYKLPTTTFHLKRNNTVERLFWGKTEVEAVASFLKYQKGERVQKLIHKLKYKNKAEIGEYLGELFGQQLALSPAFKEVDYLIPIPLHPKKLKIRGYNQSEVICNGISKALRKDTINNVLYRKIHTSTQTKKNKYDRFLNVNSIFGLRNTEVLKNKKVLLVDDVITTGSTMEACIKTLQQIEGIKVYAASLGYADA